MKNKYSDLYKKLESQEVGVYASSQGMFEENTSSESNEPATIGDYDVNKENDIDDSKSSEALSVKATKDVLKNDKIKEKLKKMSEDAKKSGLKNVTSNTDFAKFNKGKAKYDSLSRVLFFDSETKIGMFRNACGAGGLHLYGNLIKQKLHIKNQTYDVTCVFISKDGDKLVFKTLCSIKIG